MSQEDYDQAPETLTVREFYAGGRINSSPEPPASLPVSCSVASFSRQHFETGVSGTFSRRRKHLSKRSKYFVVLINQNRME